MRLSLRMPVAALSVGPAGAALLRRAERMEAGEEGEEVEKKEDHTSK